MTNQIGLLMESIQSQQQMACESIARLDEHTRNLGAVTREEIRAVLNDQLGALGVELELSSRALRELRRSVVFKLGVTGLVFLMFAGVVGALLIRHFAPSEAELQALRSRRDALAANVDRLERRGARLQWRLCGKNARLCVQVETTTPAFGEQSDYRIVKGY